MTSPGGGFLIGEAFVQVTPLTGGFMTKLAGEVVGASRAAGATAGNALGSGVKRGAAQAEQGVKSLSARMGEFGKATLMTGGPVKALGAMLGGLFVIKGLKDAIHDAREFQLRLVDLQTGAGESAANLGMVSSGLKTMSGQVGVTALNLEKALYTIESDGFHGARGLAILKAAAEGARTGLADVTTVAQSVMTVMRAYEIPATLATKATSQLIDAVAHGGVRMDEFAMGMKTVAPVAAALHIPIEQLYGAMSTITSVTHDAATGATGLRYVMNSLAAPSGVAQRAMESVGLSADQVSAALQGRGHLLGAMQLIEQHIGQTFPNDAAKQITALHDIVGGTRGMTTAVQLLGPHLREWEANTASSAAAARGAGKDVNDWASATKTFAFQADQVKAKVQAWGITVGTALLPALTETLKILQDVAAAAISSAKWLDHHRLVVLALATAYAAVKWTAIVSGFETIAIKALYAADAVKAFGAESASGLMAANPIVAGLAIGLGTLAAAGIALGAADRKAKQDVDNLTQALTRQSNQSDIDFFGKLAAAIAPYGTALQAAGINTSIFVSDLAAGGQRAATAFDAANRALHDTGNIPKMLQAGVAAADIQKLQEKFPHLGEALANIAKQQQTNRATTDLANSAMQHQFDVLGQAARQAAALDAAQQKMDTAITDSGKTVTSQFPIWDGYTAKLKLNAQTLLDNLNQEVSAITNESSNIQSLYRRGFDPEIIRSLVAKGPEYVQAANQATDAQLAKLSGIYSKRTTDATNLASWETLIGGGKAADNYIAALQAKAGAGDAAAKRLLAQTITTAAQQALNIAGMGGAHTGQAWANALTSKQRDALNAAIATLPEPLQQAVERAMGYAQAGGQQTSQRWIDAINASRGSVAAAAMGTANAVQRAIDSVRGKTVTITVAADLYGLTAAEYALQKAHFAGSPAATFYASGGPVRGGIPGQDSVPAMLMPGEWVLRTADVKALGGLGGVAALLRSRGLRPPPANLTTAGPLMPAATATYPAGTARVGGPTTAGPATVINQTIVLDKGMSYPEMVADVQRRLALAVTPA